jgi:hypothetical protein
LNTVDKKPDNTTKTTPSQAPHKKPSQPSNKPSNSREARETNGRTNLREKPIDLHYKEKNKERRLEKPNYPENEQSVE